MGFHTTLVLLLIVAGLGGVLWFTMQEPPVDERDKIHALEGRSLGQCTRMRWQLKDHIAFEVVRREDGRFGIVEPVVDRASLGYLTQIVRAWDSAELVATEFVDDETGRRDAGLLEPAATFSAEWPGGDSVSFEIGGKGALGDHRLVRRNGKIWQGRSNLYQCLNVNREDLRDHQVFLGQEGLCFALRVEMDSETGKREALELRRREGQWRLVSPWDSRAEPTTAVSFVTSVLAMRADAFLSGMIRTDGEPDVVVVAETGMGEERLELWVDQGAAYGQLPGRTGWFQFDPRTFESVFHRAMRDLRARTLVPFKNVATELAELVVDFGKGHGGRVRLLRESVSQTEAWELLEPVTYPVNWTAAGKAIQGVNNLVVIEFVENLTADEAETGLRMPGRLAVSVRGFREQQATTFWFGSTVVREGLEFCYACRADEPQSVVLVPAPAVEQLRRPFPEYCELDVLQIRVQIERIELEKPRNEPEGPPGERRVFARDDRHWLLEGAEGHRDEVRDFVNDVLRDLRGKQALDLRDGVLGEPSWTIAFCRGNGDRITALRVWDRGAEQPIVVQATKEEDLGFEVSALISKQLRELWQ